MENKSENYMKMLQNKFEFHKYDFLIISSRKSVYIV